ncbi:hypothetical protein BH11PSE11_BH11PSE11_07330 [soil metagenome]
MSQDATPPDDSAIQQLAFSKRLQSLTNKIHATIKVDEIMLDLSQEICDLFCCERLTIYAVNEDKTGIETRVKTGMDTFKDFVLPIAESSIAGYVALYKRMVNVRNVYDERELKSHTPRLNFVTKVDVRTGYVTQQNLAAPIVNEQTKELLGVVQLINSRDNKVFSAAVEEAVKDLCATLAVAFEKRLKPAPVIRSRYDPLIAQGILSLPELGLAERSARRKGLDMEEVLINEFQVQPAAIGAALASFFGVPYEPFSEQRKKPTDALIYFNTEQIETNRWFPLAEHQTELTVLTTDPEQLKRVGVVEKTYPKLVIRYSVTTHQEFRLTADQFFGAADAAGTARKSSWGFDSMHICAAAEEALANRVQAAIIEAFRTEDTADIHISLRPGAGKPVSRFHKNGSLESIRGSTLVEYQISFPAEAGEE